MADFIGETVLVTLKQPENAKVRGLVTDIINQQLKLKDGKSAHMLMDLNPCQCCPVH